MIVCTLALTSQMKGNIPVSKMMITKNSAKMIFFIKRPAERTPGAEIARHTTHGPPWRYLSLWVHALVTEP